MLVVLGISAKDEHAVLRGPFWYYKGCDTLVQTTPGNQQGKS